VRKKPPAGSTYRDDVAQSIAFSGAPHDFFARRKAEYLVDVAERFVGPAEESSLLDVGCGVGVLEPFLTPRFRAVNGVDVAADAVALAASDNPAAGFCVYDGNELPFADETFDVAFAACVLHHIEPAARRRFVGEMGRVVRGDGIVVLFEHNPYNPLTRFAVGRCTCDDGAQLLTRHKTERLLADAGFASVDGAYIITHTFSSRRLQDLERLVRRVPIGSQYYAAFRPPATGRTARPRHTPRSA
jgi:SAM-dependent methyltransferase